MKRRVLIGSLTLLLAGQANAADLKSYVMRVPAYPATPQAAGAAFGGKIAENPPTPKAVTDLEHDLTQLSLQGAPPPPSAAAQASMQASSEQIAQKMQSMTMDQRIAYAMQLQKQMAPAGPQPMALDANGTRNAQAAGAIMQQEGQDQQNLSALQAKVTSFANNWQMQDSKVSGDKIFRQQLCTESDRAANAAYLAPHLALAKSSLAQGAALEQQLRALALNSAARNAQAEAIVAQGPQGQTASAAASGTRTVTQGAILQLLTLYQSAALAAKWQHASDFNAHAPVIGPCRDNGGG
jgi:hypothetical protein